jgi:hypothetical protein
MTVVWHVVARLTGGGFAVDDAHGGYVVVDPALDGPHRRTVIEHERVHLERGITGGWSQAPASWAVVTAREELVVNQEVARRLVPCAGLRELVAQTCAAGEAVSAATVSAAFDVTDEIALVALRLLAAEAHTDTRAGTHTSAHTGSASRNEVMALNHASGASNCGLCPPSASNS